MILENIGPFKTAELDFISNEQELDYPPVICITGENGTGKSIILDAIRSLFKGRFSGVEREITSSKQFLIKTNLVINGTDKVFSSNKKFDGKQNLDTNDMAINRLFHSQFDPPYEKDFILDYWTSKLSNDNFGITSITAVEAKKYLDDSLSGIHKNIDLTKIISFFDYLKDSTNEQEKELGSSLYSILEDIINLSISKGKLSHVSRINLKPIVKIGNNEITLDKLSSGNLYLIQRFTSLLSQVYSICALNDKPISDYKNIKGLLLIDEAENHLHPKWQKVFLQNILTLFPKLQIIVSTHSPFIVSSIKNSRIYVCKSQIDFSIVEEETDYYINKPIEEILLSPLFNTNNFSDEISKLLEERKDAIENKKNEKIKTIEKKLLEINPEYFNYLNLDSIIKSIKK
ncbi:AAA family ATPase [Algibacter sp. L1A34]|uniref:AAA family ATPase n=1 Tax=Algibacter sp. L1A34 TaxID=2686365 RepID=UPI00131CFE9D|nr:AAA family ATPase [Algibacter sp. L1A34]